jgi:hypothetical protein
MITSWDLIAWSVDVQTKLIKSKLINIVPGLQKPTCQKVAYMHFAVSHGKDTIYRPSIISTALKQNPPSTQKYGWPKFPLGIIMTLSIFSFRA